MDREQLEGMHDIWKIIQKRMNPEVRERIGWKCAGDFLADVLVFGMDKSSEDPQAFIREVRECRDPIFQVEKSKKSPKGAETAWGKAYA